MSLNKISIVSFSPPKPVEPPKPRPSFAGHPTPWKIGECHESMANVLDADNRPVMKVRGGIVGIGNPSEKAAKIIALINAAAQ